MRFCWHKWSNWHDDDKRERDVTRAEQGRIIFCTFIPGQHRRCAKCNKVERRST